MALARLTLVELKELLRPPEEAPQSFSFSLSSHGIPKGALTELSGPLGSGKTEALFSFLKEHPTLSVAWVEPQITLYPPALEQRGLLLDRFLFLEAGLDSAWVCFQILKAQAFDLLVLTLNEAFPEKLLRQLQLAVSKTQMGFILLSEQMSQCAWPIRLQMEWRHAHSSQKSFFDQSLMLRCQSQKKRGGHP